MPIRGLICLAVATVIGAGAAHAQQREAILQKVDVGNSGFSIVVATARTGGATADYREQPDPNLVYLAAGDLVYGYTGSRPDLGEDAIFTAPACSFYVERTALSPRTPVVIYVMYKGSTPPRTQQPGSQ
jgi:hypothetical protein